MENKNFERSIPAALDDDALDMVSGGTAGTSSGWSVGMPVKVHRCPCCGANQVTGSVRRLIYKRSSTTPDALSVNFDCCGASASVDTDDLC